MLKHENFEGIKWLDKPNYVVSILLLNLCIKLEQNQNELIKNIVTENGHQNKAYHFLYLSNVSKV